MRRPGIAVRACAALLAIVAASTTASARPDIREEVFFAGTDRELRVYRMSGREPGPRVLILGGIHGNEPGGYLTADLLLDRFALYRGEVLLVPRVNLAAILRGERGPTGDMNRMFGDAPAADPVVDLVERLTAEADALLNLHDGWGFHRERWEDDAHNPTRYGQSVVADAWSWTTPDDRVLPLGEIASRVVAEVNRFIPEEAHRFRFLNTRTSEPGTPYRELVGSATYYALTRHGIPGFGIETSKNLPSDAVRVRHQLLVVRAFLREFGLEEDPGWFPESEVQGQADYLLVRVNDRPLLAVRPGESIEVARGDTLRVEAVEGSADRGLTVDVEGEGGVHDLGRPFTVEQPVTLVVRKDAAVLGRVEVRPSARPSAVLAAAPQPPPTPPPPAGVPPASRASPAPGPPARGGGIRGFRVEWNGERRVIPEGEVLEVAAGELIRLLDPVGEFDPADLSVDLVGFPGGNPASPRDDRGYPIHTGCDLLSRFSLFGEGEYYRVRAREGAQDRGGFFLRVLPPALYHLDVEITARGDGAGPPRLERVPAEGTLPLARGQKLRIVAAGTSIHDGGQDLVVNFRGFQGKPSGEDRGLWIRIDEDLLREWALDPEGRLYEIVVTYQGAPVGRVVVRVDDRLSPAQ